MAPKAFVLLELMNAMVLVAEQARARGYVVVALNRGPLQDAGPFAVRAGLVDELIEIRSWSDRAALDDLAADLTRRYEVVGTWSVFEATLVAESTLRELAGLPTTSVASTERVLDKLQVRAKLHDEGLSALRSVSLTQALDWSRWEFDTPAVLKPAHGTGSALCFVVSSLPELRQAAVAVDQAGVVNPLMRDYIVDHGEFVLEQRAEGELLSIESLVSDGVVRFVGLTGRYLLASDPVVEQGLFFPCPHPLVAELQAFSEQVHKSLEIGNGATHLEVMVSTDGAIELIDFNPRFAGFASVVSFGQAFGIVFESVLVDVACGLVPDLSFLDRPTRYAVEMVVLPPPGTTTLHQITFPPEAIAARATKKLGEHLTGRADQLDAVGMFIVTGDTARQAHDRAIEARRATTVNGIALGDNPNNAVVSPGFLNAGAVQGAEAVRPQLDLQ